MSHWLPWKVETAALGSALEKRVEVERPAGKISLSWMQGLLQLALLFCMVRLVGEVGCVAALPSAQCYSQDRSAGSSGAQVTSCLAAVLPFLPLLVQRLGPLCFPSPSLLL